MIVLRHKSSEEGPDDAAQANCIPAEGDQVLRAILRVTSGLDAHDGIGNNVDKSLREAREHQ